MSRDNWDAVGLHALCRQKTYAALLPSASTVEFRQSVLAAAVGSRRYRSGEDVQRCGGQQISLWVVERNTRARRHLKVAVT